MAYRVKEIFYSLQGEGARAGRPAVFCRFSGCDLWSGKEFDRARALCSFCDTDFVGTDGLNGGVFASASELSTTIQMVWRSHSGASLEHSAPYVVFTGGEPMLQLDHCLVSAVKSMGFETAVETNGLHNVPASIDWITLSPKCVAGLMQTKGHELKLVFPQEVTPESVEDLDFDFFFLMPKATEIKGQTEKHTVMALDYCSRNPRWKLTLQYNKIWGIP